MTPRRSLVLLVLLISALALPSSAGAAVQPTWAAADDATVHPGVQVVTEGSQCTANFVYYDTAIDADGEEYVDHVYLGMSAHCSGSDDSTSANGCERTSHPIGTPVEVDGASRPGTLAYNSWLTMARLGESDSNVCRYNDFALIALHPADWADVNPSIPVWGAPQGINTDGVSLGEEIYSYGNSGLRFGISQLSPKYGTAVQTSGDGWTHTVYTATPGIPGDSGSAYLDGQGRALGVVSTVAIAPLAASNNVTDLSRAMAYMAAHEADLADVVLAEGTEPFAPLF